MRLSNAAQAMLNNWRRIGAGAVRACVATALPQRCALCASATGTASLCDACSAALASRAPACPRCALPSPEATTCGHCLAHPPPFDAALAIGPYAFPLDRLVLRLKYGADLALAAALGERLAGAAAAGGAIRRVDALVPVPLSAARQRRRGCNQAREIAKALARCSGVPIARGLVRERHGTPQAGLPWRERMRNVRGVYAATRAFDGVAVALVDDVLTSGATAAAAATALRRAGAARIEVWVVARTLPG